MIERGYTNCNIIRIYKISNFERKKKTEDIRWSNYKDNGGDR